LKRLDPLDEVARTRSSLEVAWNHFEWATGKKAVDAAVFEVNVAEFHLQEALGRNGRTVRRSA
jgi:hypothetical protein